eukprot:3615183-Pleurochrysis_carterae.AAC.3
MLQRADATAVSSPCPFPEQAFATPDATVTATELAATHEQQSGADVRWSCGSKKQSTMPTCEDTLYCNKHAEQQGA